MRKKRHLSPENGHYKKFSNTEKAIPYQLDASLKVGFSKYGEKKFLPLSPPRAITRIEFRLHETLQ